MSMNSKAIGKVGGDWGRSEANGLRIEVAAELAPSPDTGRRNSGSTINLIGKYIRPIQDLNLSYWTF